MKRVLFLLVLLMTVSAVSFAQKKNVRAARAAAGTTGTDFNKAQELIDEALKNPETMNDANTWNVAGYIQQRINGEEAKRILLGQAYDTVKYNNSLLKMFEYFKKCDDIAQVPDEKGKIKNKYRKANAETLLKERSNLINGGVTSVFLYVCRICILSNACGAKSATDGYIVCTNRLLCNFSSEQG